MEPEDFAPDLRPNVIRAPDGYWAFVPPPLPPRIDLTARLVSDLSRADRSLGVLAGVGMRLPNPYLLITPFLRREAVLSSKIEGTQATLSEVVLYEASAAGSAERDDDTREVVNYVRALERGAAGDRRTRVSLRLLLDLHRLLMTGVRGEESIPGEFRAYQNWIGPPGVALRDAVHVPPPPAEMRAALDELERYLYADSDLPPLVRLALIHYQFEAIHPFLDGNGRIGRLIISLLLQEWELLPQPLLYLSAYFERRKADYYERLLGVSRRGEWDAWLRFFLTGVAEQANDAVERSSRLLALRDDYQRRLHSVRATSLPLRLIDDLFVRPALTIADAARALRVTRRAAQLNVQKLIDAGILIEATGRRRNRIFMAPEIVRLLEQDLPRAAAAA